MMESFKIKYTPHYVLSATILTAQHVQLGNTLQIISWGKLKKTFSITYSILQMSHYRRRTCPPQRFHELKVAAFLTLHQLAEITQGE